MKRRHLVLALAFLLCAGVLAFASKTPSDTLVEATPRPSTPAVMPAVIPAALNVAGRDAVSRSGIAVLRARADLFGAADGAHHALFGSQTLGSPLPSIAPVNATLPPLPSLSTLRPQAPGLPFTYLGKQSEDGRWEVYLANGEETVIAHEQTVIDGTYRVESIRPPTMTLVYLPQKLNQTLDIGSAD